MHILQLPAQLMDILLVEKVLLLLDMDGQTLIELITVMIQQQQ